MVIVGFMMLKNQGYIKLKIIPCYEDKKKYPHPHILEAVVNNKLLVYDCWDLCDWTASDWEKEKWKDIFSMESLMDGIDFYFKRSYLASKNMDLSEKNRNKIHPLGLFFRVSIENNPIDIIEKSIYIEYIKHMAKYFFYPYKLNRYFTMDKFEASANYTEAKNLKILFMARLWNPLGKDVWNEEKKAEREYVNNERIQIIKSLKRLYPNNFIGGIESSGFARKKCKELILPAKMTNRFNYLELMKRSDICIGTMGLHESIGGKTAEYVVAARAIVNEKLHYEVPFSFAPYKNYLPFETHDECIEAVSLLMKNPEQVYSQKMENEKYYKYYLRPDKQILNTLNITKII